MIDRGNGPARSPAVGVLGAVAAIIATAALAAACGSASEPQVATLRTGVPAASPSVGLSPEEAALDYAACMRQQGIAMPDPQVADGAIGFAAPSGATFDKPAYASADASCRHFLDAAVWPAATPAVVDPSVQDALLAYAQCMRDHGVAMDDPVNGEPASITVVISGSSDPPDPSQVAFATADAACAHLLPGRSGSSSAPQTGATPSASSLP